MLLTVIDLCGNHNSLVDAIEPLVLGVVAVRVKSEWLFTWLIPVQRRQTKYVADVDGT